MHNDDTIVAISTPAGRGGIGVVRLSGPDAKPIALTLVNLREVEAGRARLTAVHDAAGARIDEAVVTYFAAPHSYTAQDVVEIAAHGSPVLLQAIVQMATAAGARVAEPGEFTMRAFLNGRLDLTQAEAVRDLIDSQTLFQAKLAAQQLEGALSKRVRPAKQHLVELIAVLEAGIDFAEDDVAVTPGDAVLRRITSVREDLDALLRTFAVGHLVNEGITLAIVGSPNVGKSSLFNRLVERERAIVTEIPGTTRDTITETISLDGVPVRMIDTAGIRETNDPVERIGVERSLEAISDADAVIFVFDASQCSPRADSDALYTRVASRDPIVVANKCDIAADGASNIISGAIATSALTGEGIDELRRAIVSHITGGSDLSIEGGALTNARHEQLVRDSVTALNRAQDAVTCATPDEMVLIDLYEALRALDALTGETTPDDVLNLIFSTFCIGK